MSHRTTTRLSWLEQLKIYQSEGLLPEGVAALSGTSRHVGWRYHPSSLSEPALADILRSDGLQLEPVPHLPHAYLTPSTQREQLSHHPFHTAGHIYMQSLSSQAACYLWEIAPDHELLDMAAAPGGKSSILACQLQDASTLAAVEFNKSRFFRMKSNFLRLQQNTIRCYLKDARYLPPACHERFDRILLDAPCSSEARFDPELPASYMNWSVKRTKALARKQKQMLRAAVRYLKPGGQILYATCTYAPEENEAVISDVLKQHPELHIRPTRATPLAHRPGIKAWRQSVYPASMELAVRFLPTPDHPGLFACLLQKD